jgi:hypothetical protein
VNSPAARILDPLNYSEEAVAREERTTATSSGCSTQLKKEAQGVYLDRIVELAKGAGLEVTQ